MVQDLPKTIPSSKTTSFRSYEIFTHWPQANTVTSCPSKQTIWSESWEKISKRWPDSDFSERHSFRWKWFRTYLRPFLVQRQQVLGHMKYLPIDPKPIPWQVAPQNRRFGQNLEKKSRKGDQTQIFLKDILLGENGSGLT